jgi:hypothetical protein
MNTPVMGKHCAPAHHGGPITWTQANRAFIEHARSFVLVNLLLVGIWLVSGAGYFWPVWPILGWGVGLVGHAMATFNRSWAAEELD